ncbi:polysaccharide biosynthesis protein [Oenococcus sp. UCMA 16435]|nr:polysaccharide biosynthesis protein [Oenococcus sp. UCMA 16435]
MSCMENKKKILLVSSSGGHFEQLLMLKKLNNKFNIKFVTEKVPYAVGNDDKILFVPQINRRDIFFIFKIIFGMLRAIGIIVHEKPICIISTGAMASFPFLFIGKIMGKKIIFIESYAKSDSPTLTGKLVYKFADLFIVQWENMKTFYPKSVYLGSIY